jgi:peptidoglycan/xylan/chitin deacetylase (PgdA/CDA1 family)
MTQKLIATLRDRHVPAVGFVDERKLYEFGEVDDRIKALSLWVDSGFELGNHTYRHMSLNEGELKNWEEDTIRGETVRSLLLAQHNMKMRYFRHPFLDTGHDLQTRRAAEPFLAQCAYHIPRGNHGCLGLDVRRSDKCGGAPIPHCSSNCRPRISTHTADVFDYYEKLSREMLDYEPKQILLLHGNWLEADHVGELLDWTSCKSVATSSSPARGLERSCPQHAERLHRRGRDGPD